MVTIAIVEDSELYTMALEYKMKESFIDYNTHSYSNGQSFLNELTQVQPDVVILDYMLPDMNGEDVIAEIKQYSKELPIIVLSAQNETMKVADLIQAGAFEYVQKGDHSFERLYAAISKALKLERGYKRFTINLGFLKLDIRYKWGW